jgi:hypothetical protein
MLLPPQALDLFIKLMDKISVSNISFATLNIKNCEKNSNTGE